MIKLNFEADIKQSLYDSNHFCYRIKSIDGNMISVRTKKVFLAIAFNNVQNIHFFTQFINIKITKVVEDPFNPDDFVTEALQYKETAADLAEALEKAKHLIYDLESRLEAEKSMLAFLAKGKTKSDKMYQLAKVANAKLVKRLEAQKMSAVDDTKDMCMNSYTKGVLDVLQELVYIKPLDEIIKMREQLVDNAFKNNSYFTGNSKWDELVKMHSERKLNTSEDEDKSN